VRSGTRFWPGRPATANEPIGRQNGDSSVTTKRTRPLFGSLNRIVAARGPDTRPPGRAGLPDAEAAGELPALAIPAPPVAPGGCHEGSGGPPLAVAVAVAVAVVVDVDRAGLGGGGEEGRGCACAAADSTVATAFSTGAGTGGAAAVVVVTPGGGGTGTETGGAAGSVTVGVVIGGSIASALWQSAAARTTAPQRTSSLISR
jgi:hypothetical protein